MQKMLLGIAVVALAAFGMPATAYDFSACNYSTVAVGALYLIDDHTADKDSGSVEWIYLESNGVEDVQRGATQAASIVFETIGSGAWADSCVNHGVEGPDTVLY